MTSDGPVLRLVDQLKNAFASSFGGTLGKGGAQTRP